MLKRLRPNLKVGNGGARSSFVHKDLSLERISCRSYERLTSYHYDKNGNWVKPVITQVIQQSFPVSSDKAKIDILEVNIKEPHFSWSFCMKYGLNYTYRIWLKINQVNKEGKSSIQDLYLCDLYKMTERGTFIVHGFEKVVIMKLQRSPGLYISKQPKKEGVICKFVPQKGYWMEILYSRSMFYVRFKKGKKIPLTLLMMALGYDIKSITNFFYHVINLYPFNGNLCLKKEELFVGLNLPFSLLSNFDGSVIVDQVGTITESVLDSINTKIGVEYITFEKFALLHCYKAYEHENTYTISTDTVQPKDIEHCISTGEALSIYISKDGDFGNSIIKTLKSHAHLNKENAVEHVYNSIKKYDSRIGIGDASNFLQAMLFDPNHYSLSMVGRIIVNNILDIDEKTTSLTINDIVYTVKKILKPEISAYKDSEDVESLVYRRILNVSTDIEHILKWGIASMSKSMLESIKNLNIKNYNNVYASRLRSMLYDLFVKSEHCQLIEQHNALSELSHKRRTTCIGVGGVSRDRASLAVRDVHPTHYGRLCCVESPEGHNIGLIGALAYHASVDENGFLVTPYRIIKEGKPTEDVVYLNAFDEDNYIKSMHYIYDETDASKNVPSRFQRQIAYLPRQKVQLIDVSSKQTLSIATSLIPFVEHNVTARALMGANMQRQAVPLICSKAPMVGTGTEAEIVCASKTGLVAPDSGTVIEVNHDMLCVLYDNDQDTLITTYKLQNLISSNQNTYMYQFPVFFQNNRFNKGDTLIESHNHDQEELALGANVNIAIMCYEGHNFEDAILLSDSITEQEIFTSIHIEQYKCKLNKSAAGSEVITKDIPQVEPDKTAHLDDNGIATIGSYLEEYDVLVGKVKPKAQVTTTPEDRLLQLIFGEKSAKYENASIVMPRYTSGYVVDTSTINKEEADSFIDEISHDDSDILHKILIYLQTAGLYEASKPYVLEDILKDLTIQYEECKNNLVYRAIKQICFIQEKGKSLQSKDSLQFYKSFVQDIESCVKVTIAYKCHIQPGDKLAGRHGNKGVISKILPREDMPYTEDGTVIDMLITPLGIPSRMNIGQIYECLTGFICLKLGEKIREIAEQEGSTIDDIRKVLSYVYHEVLEINIDLSQYTDTEIKLIARDKYDGVHLAIGTFEGINADRLVSMMQKMGMQPQQYLYDGRTGKRYGDKTTIGCMYILKLDHLVDHKMHARSTGSYSLITQQPLGGKSQFGGQRFGEMEMWALQGYGASYNLWEMLTIKSDDTKGRNQIYKDIIFSKVRIEHNLPESFRVLQCELRALSLDISLKF